MKFDLMKIAAKAILIFLLLGMGCHHSEPKLSGEVKQWYGKLLFIPDKNLKFVNYTSDQLADYKKNKIKIVCSINGGCYTCVSELKLWQSFITDAKKMAPKLEFDFYIAADSYKNFEELNKQEIHFNYPMIYDYDNQFQIHNRIVEDHKMFKSFMIENNKVILVGNPAISKSIRDLYLQKIAALDLP